MAFLTMIPAPGERVARFVGDRLSLSLRPAGGGPHPGGWRALLRTNLGRAAARRQEIILAHFQKVPLAGASWHDIPMTWEGGQWTVELALPEPGYFRAKAYALDPRGWQHWVEGPDVGVSVHPDAYRTGNTIYCAFPRWFGAAKAGRAAREEKLQAQLARLDRQGYTVIPPSGKLRDVTRALPHVMDRLGCRMLHLLPVNPTPTTLGRFGRYGSPYASQDLTAIDPLLVEWDRRTTGVEQFRELAYAVHRRGGRVLLDLVINHTGWGASLFENHPEWYHRQPGGEFASPGAWGITWADLVELNQQYPELWEQFAEAFLVWCRRGVDGFRCDAGYMVPARVWQYIVARVQDEFPETIFLLEGLGGAWAATENLLTEGGMQWAYSELFQNYSGIQVAGYLDHSLKQSQRVGLLVHYSETHDNNRLAATSRAWSLLRNRLCALASVCGGYGFTAGVEWLAAEKVLVHENTALAWDAADNLVPELARLNRLLAEHPCFFDGAKLTRLSPLESPVYALWRESAEGLDRVLVLANTDVSQAHALRLEDSLPELFQQAPNFSWSQVKDLLGQTPPACDRFGKGASVLTLAPGAAFCLAATLHPAGFGGEAYRRARAQAAFAFEALSQTMPAETIGPGDWRRLAAMVDRDPVGFLAKLARLDAGAAAENLEAALAALASQVFYPQVIHWTQADARRVTPVPPGHWLLVQDRVPFRAALRWPNATALRRQSLAVQQGQIVAFPPQTMAADAVLELERYAEDQTHLEAPVRFLAKRPGEPRPVEPAGETMAFAPSGRALPPETATVLLTNGIGGMARMGVDLGRVQSKYDCVLAANLHSRLPVDRHVFVKRVRAWLNADGFITQLNADNLFAFDPGPPAVWRFVANAGDGRSVEVQLAADMVLGANTTRLRFYRPPHSPAIGRELPSEGDVRLTVRFDIEDRNFHWETKRNSGAEHHFNAHCRPLGIESADFAGAAGVSGTTGVSPAPVGVPADGNPPTVKPSLPPSGARAPDIGFAFTPAPDRPLRVFADVGEYHHAAEWSENLPHPWEQSRGQVDCGDAYSPGWFDLPLPKGGSATLVATAELVTPEAGRPLLTPCPADAERPADPFAQRLAHAIRAFIVRRGEGKTIIAGYPWFLDWGRDSLICSRGLLAAGLVAEVRDLLLNFGRFEHHGTLPNTIHGEDASNRDTSDAPLWYGVACEELAAWECSVPGIAGVPPAPVGVPTDGLPSASNASAKIYATSIDPANRTIADVLRSIVVGYLRGTPNGIRVDPESGLVWSPSHFTWMDTNHPAGTPREGYPVEIQALWIRLLRQLDRIQAVPEGEPWAVLARRAEQSVQTLYWLEGGGYFADVLLTKPGVPARSAVPDQALRSNHLLLLSLGLVNGERARRCVAAAQQHLMVPGALRSLAPLPVTPPLPIYGRESRLLNNPNEPYWGRYEGDEDSRRKPAYHNGTAWLWTFPHFCEALVRAWDFSPPAVAAARAYLGSLDRLMNEGCLGQLPEIVDGDAPHQPRGCDAQAWSATEALRVWDWLRKLGDRK